MLKNLTKTADSINSCDCCDAESILYTSPSKALYENSSPAASMKHSKIHSCICIYVP